MPTKVMSFAVLLAHTWVEQTRQRREKAKTVVCLYVSEGSRTVDGKSGWFGESGKCWHSSATALCCRCGNTPSIQLPMYTCIPGSVVNTLSRRPDSLSYSDAASFSSSAPSLYPSRQKQWSRPGLPPPSMASACSQGRPSRKSNGESATGRLSPVGI